MFGQGEQAARSSGSATRFAHRSASSLLALAMNGAVLFVTTSLFGAVTVVVTLVAVSSCVHVARGSALGLGAEDAAS